MEPEFNHCPHPNCGELLDSTTMGKFKYVQHGNEAFWICPKGHKEEAGNKGVLEYRKATLDGKPLITE